MALNLDVGDTFPDITLPDDRGNERPLSEIAKRQPLFLAFFRGPW